MGIKVCFLKKGGAPFFVCFIKKLELKEKGNDDDIESKVMIGAILNEIRDNWW